MGVFAVFLWFWTGSPFASLIAQRDGWSEKTDVFAVLHLAQITVSQISFSHFDHPTIDLNLVVGLVGAIVLIVLLVLVVRNRREMSVEAIVWTFGISWLAMTSEYTPPNPRLLITAFPAVIVLARYVHGKWWTALVVRQRRVARGAQRAHVRRDDAAAVEGRASRLVTGGPRACSPTACGACEI